MIFLDLRLFFIYTLYKGTFIREVPQRRLRHMQEDIFMIKIAIVEDTPAEAQTLSDSVAAFFKKEGAAFECTVYGDAMSFLTGYKSVYDMVFMDIELPLLDA